MIFIRFICQFLQFRYSLIHGKCNLFWSLVWILRRNPRTIPTDAVLSVEFWSNCPVQSVRIFVRVPWTLILTHCGLTMIKVWFKWLIVESESEESDSSCVVPWIEYHTLHFRTTSPSKNMPHEAPGAPKTSFLERLNPFRINRTNIFPTSGGLGYTCYVMSPKSIWLGTKKSWPRGQFGSFKVHYYLWTSTWTVYEGPFIMGVCFSLKT